CSLRNAASKARRHWRAGLTWFSRGVSGLQRWLSKLWKSKAYYLGERHFHPYAAPNPSGTDISKRTGVAKDDLCKGTEPVLVILGGDAAADWQLRRSSFRGATRTSNCSWLL